MSSLTLSTDFALLSKFWDVEEVFPIENRTQFRNAFIAALSGLSGEESWNAALKTAKANVLQNLIAKGVSQG